MTAGLVFAPLVVTAGEPAGIGPDLCVQLAKHTHIVPLVVIADKNLLLERAAQLQIDLQVRDYIAGQVNTDRPDILTVIHVPLNVPCRAGVLNAANSQYVLATLQHAVQGCQTGEFSGMVTGPVHKSIINDAGITFTGHTEFLAEQTGTKLVVMLLVGGGMRVALATTHLALKDVPGAITAVLLENVLHIIHRELQTRFNINQPRILVAGLNPHAGEDGYLGREEIEVIIPLLDKLRNQGINVSGPLPADTLFTPYSLAQGDCVVAMYHDQGLPTLKHASFGQGVNVTLGLPIIRTSVDHGTALDLAGTGRADCGSMMEAIKIAAQMVRQTPNRNA
ncbi:MAG TPA: 4-hydroxythreonine-4-phosphate dehydrogenase PdxA [Gallionella sp.]|nr:4-hydroxythreonine-4-phosphate dehydrogenase PdxA [Gallionella sp.]